jgi:very-short-patch-repair endonuclease
LRQRSTPAEALLWEALRGRRLGGLKFRRQQPVRGFVVDFYCEAKDLVIELDGPVHDSPEAGEADRQRQMSLEGIGLRVMRFKNADVERDLDAVLSRIQGA